MKTNLTISKELFKHPLTLLLVTTGWAVARFVAWQHEGWAGFYYVPTMPEGYKGKPVLFKPGSVSSVFSAYAVQSARTISYFTN
jgi:hypothetical protein